MAACYTFGAQTVNWKPKDDEMRKVIYAHMVSLDGFIEAVESYKGPHWAVSDEELSRHFIDLESTIDAHLCGRRIYENLATWWPHAAKDPSTPEYLTEYARIWVNKPKIVFSRTLDHVEWNARLVKQNAAEEIAKLKSQPGKDLALYGGVLASSVIPHDLIDEYRFYVNPAVLGRGKPMFPALDNVLRLRLVETRAFGCVVVLLRYSQSEERQ